MAYLGELYGSESTRVQGNPTVVSHDVILVGAESYVSFHVVNHPRRNVGLYQLFSVDGHGMSPSLNLNPVPGYADDPLDYTERQDSIGVYDIHQNDVAPGRSTAIPYQYKTGLVLEGRKHGRSPNEPHPLLQEKRTE
jgi:hypothetical protein